MRGSNLLNDKGVLAASAREKPYKLTDGRGLYLLVNPKGGKYWRYDYAIHGKRKTAALGVYPSVSLKSARAARDKAKEQLVAGIDPAAPSEALTFGEVASEWMAKRHRPASAEPTIRKTEWLLSFMAPLNDRELNSIKPKDVLERLRFLESGGHLNSAHRLRSICSRIWRYAVASDRAERDICADLAGALAEQTVVHRAAPLDPVRIGQMMRAIRSYTGHPATRIAMQLGALTFVRPYELRFAAWEEFDLATATWRIPAERMKMKRDHIVPLSRQALACLAELRSFYKPVGLLFPSQRSDDGPIGKTTVNMALRAMGFSKEAATHHGFRRMASTHLNEAGWNFDWVERQLAHFDSNVVRRAYNAAEYLQGRVEMMQAWADMLDEFEALAARTAKRTEEIEEDLIG